MMRWNCSTCGALVKREVHPDGLIMAKAVAREGQCIFCEEPIVQTRGPRRVICQEPGCKVAYHTAYNRDRRFRRGANT